MTTQPTLFSRFAATRTRQPELFTGSATDLRCEKCGRYLVETECGYITCPKGCGKLLPVVTEYEGSGLWFEDDGDA